MKKFFMLLTLMAFAMAAPLAMAKEAKINCCVKGSCKKNITQKKCDDLKGDVVKNCKDCKKPPKTKK